MLKWDTAYFLANAVKFCTHLVVVQSCAPEFPSIKKTIRFLQYLITEVLL